MKTNKKNNEESIFSPAELKKIRSRVHTPGQLWLMDDLLRQIVAFMPEKQDYHIEWREGSVFIDSIQWMMRLRPQYQTDFFTKKEKICLEYLLLERLPRFVCSVHWPLFGAGGIGTGNRIKYVDIRGLQTWALEQRKHLPAWLAWLADLWYNRGKDCWVYDEFDWMELDPRPLVKRIRERRGADWCKIYDQNCPDEYRV